MIKIYMYVKVLPFPLVIKTSQQKVNKKKWVVLKLWKAWRLL